MSLRRSHVPWLISGALLSLGAPAEGQVTEPALPGAPDATPPAPAPEATLALHVHGRLQFDHYTYLTPGASEAGLQSTFLLKRLNFVLAGEVANTWQFFLQADLAPAGLNTAGSPVAKPAAAIIVVNRRLASWLNVQAGQLLTPVTLDHRLLSLERVVLENGLVQQLGAPSPVEIGASVEGETSDRRLSYEVGVFNGDGVNRSNPDDRVDVIGRIATRPLAAAEHVLKDLQLGGSFRLGTRDPAHVTYDMPALATQGGFAFWRATYDGPAGVTHILPAGSQHTLATEARLPADRFDVLAEVVHVSNGTREVARDVTTPPERTGTLSGTAAYGQLGVWAMGSRAILGPSPHPPASLEFVARGEMLRARYWSGRTGEGPDAPNADGEIRVYAFLAGAKYWWSPNFYGTVNYGIYEFPGSGPVVPDPAEPGQAQTERQRAVAPGNTLRPGASEAARTSHSLHELLFRFELGF